MKPEEVFTPRARDVNARMYVERPELEEHLSDALRGDKYIVVHGESGNGKTWLFKRVLERENVEYETVNLSNAILYGGLIAAFERKLGELGYEATDQISVETEVSGNAGIVSGKRRSTTVSKIVSAGAFVGLLAAIRERAKSRRAVLVLDNFEQVVDNQDVLRSIAALIISADEDVIAEQKVKILIVGVPSDIRQLVAKIANTNTIANRLIEIPEVARMTEEEAISLMDKGFSNELKYTIEGDKESFYKTICWKTDRIAQQLHELCLKIAIEAERDGGVVSPTCISKAEKKWLNESLKNDLEVVDGLVNSRETKVGRKNQTLYTLGQTDKEDFKASEIETILRETFEVEEDTKLNMFQMLAFFANAKNPLLRRTPRGDAYRFVSPKVRMALRTGLQVEGNKVVKTPR